MYSPTSLVALGIVLPLLGVFAVCVRLGVRIGMRRSVVGPDDWMIVAGSFMVCAMGANELIGKTPPCPSQDDADLLKLLAIKGTYQGGLGRHTPLSPEGKPMIDRRTRITLKVRKHRLSIWSPPFSCAWNLPCSAGIDQSLRSRTSMRKTS